MLVCKPNVIDIFPQSSMLIYTRNFHPFKIPYYDTFFIKSPLLITVELDEVCRKIFLGVLTDFIIDVNFFKSLFRVNRSCQTRMVYLYKTFSDLGYKQRSFCSIQTAWYSFLVSVLLKFLLSYNLLLSG